VYYIQSVPAPHPPATWLRRCESPDRFAGPMTSSLPPRPATRQLADLLLGLAAVMQRLHALPDGHPLIAAGFAALARAIETALAGRGSLIVQVGTVQLSIDGMETNPEFEPLRDCANFFRGAGVSALEFRPGVTAEELATLLTAMVAQAGSGRRWPLVPHISVSMPRAPVLADGEAWLTLERLVFEEPRRAAPTRDPEELAFALEMLPAATERDTSILEALSAVSQAGANHPAEQALLSRLLGAIPMATLRRLLAPLPGSPAQGAFLRSVGPQVETPVLLRLLQAAVHGRQAELSPAALQVLARMARRSNDPEQRAARRALAAELTRLAPVDPDSDLAAQFPRIAPEPERVLKLALESGILEPGTLAAADRMIARRQVAPLLALLDTVPEADPVARALAARVYHPTTVRAMLGGSPVELEVLDRLIPAAGIEAAPVLLEGLAESRDRRVRLALLDFLTRYGTAIGPLAAERIEGMPWYVQRNLLALLGRLPDRPMRFTPPGMLAHRDPRVRHEALALAIADSGLRNRGLAEALESSYEPTLRLAFRSLLEHCPPEFVPRLIARAADQDLDPELRAAAIAALAPVNDPVVLRVLRRSVVARGITALGRLAPKSPVMLAALRGLTAHWRDHPKVVPLLETARQSRDPEVRAAARSQPRRSSGTLPRAIF
jgi:hypothetical protein